MNDAVTRAAMVRIGFTKAAAQQALVEIQGMDTLEEIKLLTNDEIESLCKVAYPTSGRHDPRSARCGRRRSRHYPKSRSP